MTKNIGLPVKEPKKKAAKMKVIIHLMVL